jgi:hypothetical protein
MEVGQDPNWGCRAKEKKMEYNIRVMNLKGSRRYSPGIFLEELRKATEIMIVSLRAEIPASYS